MMKKMFTKNILIWILIFIGFGILIKNNVFHYHMFQQFVELSSSFLNGQLHFISSASGFYDSSIFQNKYYWPLGPMPAVILMPFVFIFGSGFQQGYLQFGFILLTFFLLFKIARIITKNTSTSLWLSFAFIFSTAYIGVAVVPWAWQFAQITAVTLMFLAFFVFYNNKSLLLAGLFFALAVATRMNLVLGLSFFALIILFEKNSFQKKVEDFLIFISPSIFIITLLLLYNYLRFNSFFEQGYSFQYLTNPELLANRNAGLWSFVHFPANFYYLFLKGPDPVLIPGAQILTYPYLRENPWGMSIFLTSPIFIWIKNASLKAKEVQYLFFSATFIAISVLGYYGIGFVQYGFRYALDFYPFLFILLCYAFKEKMGILPKCVITFSFLFNIFLIFTN